MNLRKLSDLCLLALLATAGSVLRVPAGHQLCAHTSLVTPVETSAQGVQASKHSFPKPVSPRAPKPAGWFEEPPTEGINRNTTWRNA